jgi:hypothetical protein
MEGYVGQNGNLDSESLGDSFYKDLNVLDPSTNDKILKL